MCFVFLVIFLFVPWQVAFLGSWIIHLYTCALSTSDSSSSSTLAPATELSSYYPVAQREPDEHSRSASEPQVTVNEEPDRPKSSQDVKDNNRNHSMHLLLLMTWLLPLAAPVLVVWVRTLAMAGLTTPFDGDHFFLNVAPFLVLVDFASWTTGPIFERQRYTSLLVSQLCLVYFSAQF